MIRRIIAERRRSALLETATAQISRLTAADTRAEHMLHGEALIISGVLAAVTRLVSSAWTALDSLAARVGRASSEVSAFTVQIAQLPHRRHIVAPAHRGRPGQLPSVEETDRRRRRTGGFLTGMRGPRLIPQDAVFGDALSTSAAVEQHALLNEGIAADVAAGRTRHHHHVAPIWQRAARVVLFFDVVALATLTITLENVSFDPMIWQEQPAQQVQRLLTAVCFALFAAMVVAVISHQVGAHTWRHLHRSSPLLAGSAPDRRWLIGGWALLGVLAGLMGVAIFARLQHEAANAQSGGSVAMCVALLIGFSGVAAPLAVGLVEALHSSPEVLRRAALARIIQAANHDRQDLMRRAIARRKEMVELVAAGERLLADTRRRVDAEGLPAHQAILTLRTRHGYAGEYATSIAYPTAGAGYLPDLDHQRQLEPLVTVLERMRGISAAAAADDAEPSEQPTGDPIDVRNGVAAPSWLIHNGTPVTAP